MLKTRRLDETKRFFYLLAEKFQTDRTTTLAASLAFYAVLSIAPLSVLILFGFSQLDEHLVDRFIEQANTVVGYSGGSAIELAIRSAQGRPVSGGLASLVSLALVLFSASAMFSELRESLGIVFRSGHGQPKKTHFFHTTWHLVRDRLLSALFALVFVIGLACFLVISALLSAAAELIGLLHLELGISFALYTAVFSLLFMYGTYRGLRWRPALKGAVFTSVLMILGKTVIGFYIGNSFVAGAYGAAGSVVALLLWIFCAALIMLTGAQAGWLFSTRGREYMANHEPIELKKAV
jgi:membrane protein